MQISREIARAHTYGEGNQPSQAAGGYGEGNEGGNQQGRFSIMGTPNKQSISFGQFQTKATCWGVSDPTLRPTERG